MTLVIAVVVALVWIPFLNFTYQFQGDSIERGDELYAAFQSMLGFQAPVVEMGPDAFLREKDTGVDLELQAVSNRLYTSAITAGFCSMLIEAIPGDDPVVLEARKEDGSDCTPDINPGDNPPPNIQNAVEQAIDPAGGRQYMVASTNLTLLTDVAYGLYSVTKDPSAEF